MSGGSPAPTSPFDAFGRETGQQERLGRVIRTRACAFGARARAHPPRARILGLLSARHPPLSCPSASSARTLESPDGTLIRSLDGLSGFGRPGRIFLPSTSGPTGRQNIPSAERSPDGVGSLGWRPALESGRHCEFPSSAWRCTALFVVCSTNARTPSQPGPPASPPKPREQRVFRHSTAVEKRSVVQECLSQPHGSPQVSPLWTKAA